MTGNTTTLDIARSKIIIRGFPDAPAKAPGTINLLTTSLPAQSGGTVTVQAERSGGSDGPVTGTITLSDGRTARLEWDNGETGTKDAMFTMPDAGTIAIVLTAIGAVVGVAAGVIAVTASKPGKINLTTLSQQVIAGNAITVSASRDNGTDGPASVDYRLSSGETGTLAWLDGEGGAKSETIATDINAPPATITITLSNATGASLGVKSGTITLIAAADPGTVDLVTTDFAVTAGADATITFARSGGTRGKATAHYSLSDGTTGSIVWQDGQSGPRSETIPTQSADAGTTLTVTLDSVDGAVKGVSTGTLRINAPVRPGELRFTQLKFAAVRGTVAAVLVERVNGTDGPVSVTVTTADGTAHDGVDYIATQKTLQWKDGEGGTKIAPIQTLGQVAQPTPGTIEFAQANFAAAAGSDAPIVLRRVGGKTGEVSATLDTYDGTARAGTDYSSIHQTVTWPDGDDTPKTVDIKTLLNAPPPSTTGVSAVITLASPTVEVLHIDDAPLGVSALKRSDNTDHPDLAVCVYPDCVVFENCWPDSAGDYKGRLQVSVDGTTVFDQTGVNLWKFSRTRPIRQGFTQITPTRNWDPMLLPNYGVPAAGLHSFIDYYRGADNGINGRGISTVYDAMGNVGGQEPIGVLPGHDLPWALVGGGDNWTVVRGTADASAVWPMHVRDRATGNILDHTVIGDASFNEPYLGRTWHDAGTDHTNPVTSLSAICPYKPDAAHMPGANIIAYLSTASDYDADQMAFWGMYHFIEQNAAHYDYTACTLAGQTRGIAWGLRHTAYCAKLLPADHPLKASFNAILDHNFQVYWNGNYAPGNLYDNVYGAWLTNGTFAYGNSATEVFRCGLAMWQDDFVTSVMNQVPRLGFANWTAFRNFKAKFAMVRMTTWNYQMATWYECWLRDKQYAGAGQSAPASQLLAPEDYETQELQYTYDGAYSQWIASLDPTTGRLSDADALTAFGANLHGDTGGAMSYPANLQPALAAAVDAGLPGAAEAWDSFLAHSHIDYTTDQGNQFNIVPQAA